MKHLAFDEIVRNLLVYLKGQIPSLSSKTTKEEILKQVQNITFTLRTTIVQLEGAAYHDPRGTEEYAHLEKDLEALKQTNTKLEESLFLEMNKTQELNERLFSLNKDLDAKREELEQLTKELENTRKKIEELEKSPKEIIKEVQVPVEVPVEVQVPSVDQSQLNELKETIAELETRLSKTDETNNNLKQALQNKEIELTKAKETLVQAMELDKSEIENLKSRLADADAMTNENTTLRARIGELEAELKSLPSPEVFKNNIASAEAKISYLESALRESNEALKEFQENDRKRNPEILIQEKEELQQRIIDLEATLRSLINARESSSKAEKFAFTPEECIFLFETLSTTANRLSLSPENRDIFQKSKDAINILQQSNAIQKVLSVGQIFDPKLHKAVKSYRSEFLPDNTVLYEENPGFISGNRLIQRALVWVGKSSFTCGECKNPCRSHEFFCPKCGLELTAPDGTSKRDLSMHPTDVEPNLPLLDELIHQNNYKAANALIKHISREHPDNPEITKRQNLLIKAENTAVSS
ncbi:MAG: GrpE [Clostridiales bacterium]|nr:GrpE [Clostridiales bacterium]MDN5281706.1 GrpE [Candidatus Ozemobacter sp.]